MDELLNSAADKWRRRQEERLRSSTSDSGEAA
jgi:hypothetical protein